jgi:hypothetical protein
VANVETSIIIERPLEEVFDHWADGRLHNRWDALGKGDARLLTPEPIGLGSRFRGTFLGAGMVEWGIFEYARPGRLTLRSTSEIGDVQVSILCVPAEGGTRMTQRAVTSLTGRWRLLGPLMRFVLAYHFRRNNRALKSYLEMKSDAPSAHVAGVPPLGTPAMPRRTEMVLSNAFERYAMPRSAPVEQSNSAGGFSMPRSEIFSERDATGRYVPSRPLDAPDEVAEPVESNFSLTAPPRPAPARPRRSSSRKTAEQAELAHPKDFLPDESLPLGGATRPRRRQPQV